MTSPIGLVLVFALVLALLTGCGGARDAGSRAASVAIDTDSSSAAKKSEPPTSQDRVAAEPVKSEAYIAPDSAATQASAEYQQISLNQADTAASAAEAADRKIIRNANLTMEVNSTTDTHH